MSTKPVDLKNYWFFGESRDFVLIVAGIHPSELGGIEVANWIRVKLMKQDKWPQWGVIIIPEVFPYWAKKAREEQWKAGDHPSDSNKFREIKLPSGQKVAPARQFPPPGKPLSFLKDGVLLDNARKKIKDDQGQEIPLLPEIEDVIRCIEALKPVRIVSIHGKRPHSGTPEKGRNWPGVFVDPRYDPSEKCQQGFDLEACKFNFTKDPAFPKRTAPNVPKVFNSAKTPDGRKDDVLALAVAKAVSNPTLIVGNHLDDPPQVVHYAKEPGTPNGFSLGDWGPVKVELRDQTGPGSRPGAPVLTIEVLHYPESWAFLDGEQIMDENGKPLPQKLDPQIRATSSLQQGPPYPRPRLFNQQRSKELQAYADAIIGTVLQLA